MIARSAIGLALLSSLLFVTAGPSARGAAAATKNEHLPPVPLPQHISHRSDQLPTGPGGRRARPAAAAAAPFLTRPYWSPHAVTSVFDHCNPDYTQDGLICEDDGTVASRSNGVDPTFSSGYAITPGGHLYVYYDGHNGWDLALSYENLLAAADGTVMLDGYDAYNPGFGQTVTIDHGNGFTTRYAHMSSVAVHHGDHVARGQFIGVSGNTGNSTGPHLHFGVYVTASWTAIDPWGWSGSQADPWPADSGNLWLMGNPQDPVPFAPTGVVAQAGDASALVTWSAPGFDGGSGISAYTVIASPGGATVQVPGSSTSATVRGLRNGTAYTFTVTAGGPVGAGPASAPSTAVTPVLSAGALTALTPARILDTRQPGSPIGRLASQQTVEVPVLGVAGVPASGVASVVLNLTAVNGEASGFIAAFPGGTAWPGTSSVNFSPGAVTAALVQAAVGTNGKVALANGSPGGVDLVADIFGWSANGAGTQGPAGRFVALPPARILDTRDGTGGIGHALAAGQPVNLQVAGRGGVPSAGASAVVLNLTVTGPTAGGFVAAWPTGSPWNGTSNVNFVAGQTIPNRVILPLGAGGQVSLVNATGSADVIADVAGWYTDTGGTGGGVYTAANPARLLDTRDGTGGVSGPLQPRQPISLQIAGVAGVPASGVTAVVLTLTGVDTTDPCFVVAYPAGTSWPLASDLNLVPGRISSNLVVVKVGAGGQINLIATGRTQLAADLVGWYS